MILRDTHEDEDDNDKISWPRAIFIAKYEGDSLFSSPDHDVGTIILENKVEQI